MAAKTNKNLIQHEKSVAFPDKRLHTVCPLPTEKKHAVFIGAHLKLLDNDCRQSCDGFSHIRVAANDVDVIYLELSKYHGLLPPEALPEMAPECPPEQRSSSHSH